ncbi:Threonine/homoserine/homoserine lactone efflux protein [Aliiroseovarius halocynthiae]|uniref:LysE family translocator n=1 Tax=Aliiroseovarius halocynthiae TaxID=985055 RepID=A0A545SLR5_9RHOB|nr:LysE family translocator [Aliiroseovarius halocynthiae]TQV65919.1 LysE family translocator [Aliiroseovarius halocynthiae]SMR83448.1 Threonine/homoserine/homoserine lactone efflux protein [Aliiroseovarius halocynthiae]
MTITFTELGFYIIGLFILFLTPGPVWVALVARTLAGGFKQAWPLTMGVAIGDFFWAIAAALGMGWIASSFDGAMFALKIVAALFFLWMGFTILRSAKGKIRTDGKLTQPGVVAGFLAGLIVILANPKAILFYMGVLPGFFDLSALTKQDILLIATASFVVPLVGNLMIAFFVGRARALLSSEAAVQRMNQVAGGLLIIVGCIIPFT